jgi:8-oxo-dGTP pyrophosphatase MutT (NUDIX family)
MLCMYNTKHGDLRVEPPGGKRKGDEDIEQCMLREFMEETGCEVRIKDLIGVYETRSPEGSFNVYMYLVEIVNGEPENKENAKHSELTWHSYKELEQFKKEGDLVPNLCEALPKLKGYFTD